jgi:hypothetical protein
MKIQIGFSRTNTIPSRLIRWITKSEVSHTYIKLDDDFLGLPLILHVDWPGAVIVSESEFLKENEKVEEYEIESEKFRPAIKKNLIFLGKKYDYWNLIAWGIAILFRRTFKKKEHNRIEDPKKLICVDFVLRITNAAQITDLPLGEMTPKMLRDRFNQRYEENGWKKKQYN